MVQPVVQRVKKVREDLTKFFDRVCGLYCTDELISELMLHRKYHSQKMFDTLKEVGIFKVDYLSDITMFMPDITNDQFKEWGLVSEKGEYILAGRYVVAIRDISGKVVALVGWHPMGGSRKYVTTPTLGFSRDATFLNYDCFQYSWSKWNGVVYLVEGIFDAIALRSLGLPAIANQGLEMSLIKTQMLSRFSKIVCIPDNDKSGKSVNELTQLVSGKSSKFVWHIETDHVFVELPSDVKDIDFFIRDFDAYDDLVSCQSKRYIVKLKEEE